MAEQLSISQHAYCHVSSIRELQQIFWFLKCIFALFCCNKQKKIICFTEPGCRLSLSDEVPTASALPFTLVSYPRVSEPCCESTRPSLWPLLCVIFDIISLEKLNSDASSLSQWCISLEHTHAVAESVVLKRCTKIWSTTELKNQSICKENVGKVKGIILNGTVTRSWSRKKVVCVK